MSQRAMRLFAIALGLAGLTCTRPPAQPAAAPAGAPGAKLFAGLSDHTHPISTRSTVLPWLACEVTQYP